MRGFAPVEFLRLALTLIRADEILQRRFTLRNGRLRAVDLHFQFPDAVFHLLALDGIQALPLGGGCSGVEPGMIAVGGRFGNRLDRLQLPADVLILLGAPTLLPPEIVFIIAGIDFNLPVSDFENPGGQFVDKVPVVRHEDDGAGVIHEGVQQDIFGA